MTVSPASRLARGWLAALVSTLAASASHWMGGGAALMSLGTLVALLLSAIVCIALAGREMSLRRITAGVGLSQIAFHTLFALLGGAGHAGHTGTGSLPAAAASPAVAHLTAHAGHLASVPVPADPGGTAGLSLTDVLFGGSLLMAASHLGAALVTIAALRQSECILAALCALADLLLPRLPESQAACIGAPARAALALSPRPLTDLGLVLSGESHRGPPAFALAA